MMKKFPLISLFSLGPVQTRGSNTHIGTNNGLRLGMTWQKLGVKSISVLVLQGISQKPSRLHDMFAAPAQELFPSQGKTSKFCLSCGSHMKDKNGSMTWQDRTEYLAWDLDSVAKGNVIRNPYLQIRNNFGAVRGHYV